MARPAVASPRLVRVALLAALAWAPVSSLAQGLPAGTELVVADVTGDAPGSRDALTIAVDLDAPPAANTALSAIALESDTPGHLACTAGGDVVLVDSEADPSFLGGDPAGGLGRGGVFMQGAGTRDLTILADGRLCGPAGPGCGPDGVFVDPRGVAWSEALGVSFVVDPEADPSLLGPDRLGGHGHGAVFVVDDSGAVTLASDGTVLAAGFPGAAPAFDEPVAAALGADGTLFVVDARADPLGLGWRGAVFAVDTTTGAVSLVTADAGFQDLRDVAVEPAGSLLILDGLAGGTGEIVRSVLAPPPNIVSRVPSALFRDLRALTVGPDGAAYVVDAAADPLASGAGGAIFRVDVDASAVTVASSTADFSDPTGIDVVTVAPPQGCGVAPGDSLRLSRDGCLVQMSWAAGDAACGETFRIWRGLDARPDSEPCDFPTDPAYEDVTWSELDADATNGWAILHDCGDALAFYLVGRVNGDLTDGPVGAYGR